MSRRTAAAALRATDVVTVCHDDRPAGAQLADALARVETDYSGHATSADSAEVACPKYPEPLDSTGAENEPESADATEPDAADTELARLIDQARRRFREAHIGFGDCLSAIRARVPRGRWKCMVEQEFGISVRTATNHIRASSLARQWAIPDATPHSVVLSVAAAPDDVRAALVSRAEAGEVLSLATVRQAIRDARQPRRKELADLTGEELPADPDAETLDAARDVAARTVELILNHAGDDMRTWLISAFSQPRIAKRMGEWIGAALHAELIGA